MTPAEASQQLQKEAELLGRAAIARVDPGPSPSHEVAEALSRLLGAHARVIDLPATEDHALQLLNTQRDRLLHSQRAVVLVCPAGAPLRRMFREMPDLTAALDLDLSLSPAPLPWSSARPALHEAQAERYRFVNLSGLVPHTSAFIEVPLDDVYQRRRIIPYIQGSRPVEPPDHHRLQLLLAAPGAGKSTWLQARARAGGTPLPLYVPLSSWVSVAQEEHALPLDVFLERYAAQLLGQPQRVAIDWSKVELLLDGLDEVPSLPDRRRLFDQALALVRAGARVILSGRSHLIDDLLAKSLRRAELCTLPDLNHDQARALVTGLLQARKNPQADQLTQQILRHQDFRHFKGNPLLLTFMVVLTELGRGVPSQRAELYHELLEMLITSWRLKRNQHARRLSRADILRVVAPLAWRLVDRSLGGLPEPDLLSFLVTLEAHEHHPTRREQAARQRLNQLRDDTALLQVSGGRWRFNHATIAEFLAARAVLQSPKLRGQLVENPYDPSKQQVLAFALALSVDLEPRDEVATPLIEALKTKARRRGTYNAKIPRTLSACLTACRGLSYSDRYALTAHTLRITFEQRLTTPRRVEAVDCVLLLCHLDDSATIDALRATLLHPSFDWQALLHTGPWMMQVLRVRLMLLLTKLPLSDHETAQILNTWISHPDPAVRALAWGLWLPAHLSLDAYDPDAVPALPSHRRALKPPAAWTQVMTQHFPALPPP